MDLLVEPVKNMAEKACEAASSLISEYKGSAVKIELEEFIDNDIVALYLKADGVVVFKRVWKLEVNNDVLDARTALYGTFLTEAIATYVITALKVKEVESKPIPPGKGILDQIKPGPSQYNNLSPQDMIMLMADMKKGRR